MYDVVILGGGPAGSEALFRLAKAGIRSVLIEKRSKGQGKPCGGAIFQKEAELFGELPSDVYDYPYTKAVLKTNHCEDLILRMKDYDMPAGYGVKREIYDTYLMESAQNAGGKIRFKERVLNVHRGDGHTSIETNKGTYQARFVFIALGWRGLSHFREMGLRKYPYKRSGVGVQKVLAGEYFKESNTICFYFLPELPGGYFWVFPKRGATYVGGGTDVEYLRGKNLVSIVDAFVAQQFGAPKIIRKEGGLIPHCAAATFSQNGVFLLGDSAGLANPLHGGGILEARLSGKFAAQAVEEYLAGRMEDPGSHYSGCITKNIINNTHRWDAIIRRVLISPTPRKKLWSLAQEDPQFREALNIVYSYGSGHFKPFRIILERVFQKLQQEMEEAIRPYQDRINSELNSLFPQDSSLDRLINYSLLGPGKRLRASLVFLMCEALGVDGTRAMPAALSYELAHTASLVHDDIIDEAHKRRGKASVVAQFGMDGAIVSGDALIMKAYEISMSRYRRDELSKEDLIDLVECATRTGLKACHGELLDVKIGREPEKYSVAAYIRLVEQKTASLIEGPCEAAAILAGKKEMRSVTRLFGRYLGIAFQILDDAKDIFASEDSSLKGRFADFRNGKPNLYIISLMKKAREEDRSRLKNLLARGNLCEEDIQFIYRICDDTGVFNSVKRILGSYLRKANNMLDNLPESLAKTRLGSLIDAMGYWKDL